MHHKPCSPEHQNPNPALQTPIPQRSLLEFRFRMVRFRGRVTGPQQQTRRRRRRRRNLNSIPLDPKPYKPCLLSEIRNLRSPSPKPRRHLFFPLFDIGAAELQLGVRRLSLDRETPGLQVRSTPGKQSCVGIHVYICYMCVYIYVLYTHTCIQVYVHTYTHTHIYIYIYILYIYRLYIYLCIV